MQLPDFLIIGAMKAGTSSVHHYLQQHPAVFTSKRKEIDFFSHHYERGLKWYMRQFPSGIGGESSPNYLKCHLWPETPVRIHKHLPDARLICVLRNPIDRTLSHYLHNIRKGREPQPFSKDLSTSSNVVRTSCYAWQLDHYLAHFRSDQLKLIRTEDLDHRPEDAIRELLRFIGVDDSVPIDTSRRYNVTASKLTGSGARVPDDPRLVVDADDQLSLTPDARAELAELLRSDVAQLRSTWPQFPGWPEFQ